MLAERFDAFLFDLDGTVYLRDEVLPEARESLIQLRRDEKEVRFLTNDPRPTRAEVTQRLNGMGIEVHQQDIITSGWATARYLKKEGVRSAYVVGSHGLVSEILAAGVEVVESGHPEAVVVGGDEHTSYAHIKKAARFILDEEVKARFVATNPDGSYPTPEGRIPGAGAMVAAIEAVTDKQPYETIGKPYPAMFEMALADLGMKDEDERKRVAMVGDNPLTDILGACRAKIAGILIETELQYSSGCKDCVPYATIPNLSFLLKDPVFDTESDPETAARR